MSPKPLMFFSALCILSGVSFLAAVNYRLLSEFFGSTTDTRTKDKAKRRPVFPAWRDPVKLNSISLEANRELGVSVDSPGQRQPDGNLFLCPEKPSGLVGDFKENLEYRSIEELETMFLGPEGHNSRVYNVQNGGHFQPRRCAARQRLAVLIPFRNRHRHLSILLNNLVPVLKRQNLDFRFFIIEQSLPTTFNRGMLFNVGFLEASRLASFDCVVFHDVDLFPVNDNVIYRCQRHPLHLIAAGSKYNYSLPYRRLNGGALLMRTDTFSRINGFSNLYFGWGSEDDDIRTRLISKDYKIIRYPRRVGRYFQLSHGPDEGNEENGIRFRLVREGEQRQDVEGLGSTVYEVMSVDLKPLYTWIRVSINMSRVLQTAPNSTRAIMEQLFQEAKRFDGLNRMG